MLLEMHAHTSKHSSCSIVDPVIIVKQTLLKGLQGIIITEHHYLWTEKELKELRSKAEINDNFLLLSAQEVQTDIGHVLVYGAEKTIKEKISLSRLREQFPDAALVWAHPFRNGQIPEKGKLFNPLIDAFEIFSTNHTQKENYLGLRLWHEYKFTAVSGSDTHYNDKIGLLPTQFDHPVENINEVVTEIKAGRVRPFFKEIPKSGSNSIVTEVTFGTKGEDEQRNRIIIKKTPDAKKWEKEKLSAEINGAIYNKGFDDSSKFRVPQVIEISAKDNMIIEEGQRGKNLFDTLLKAGLPAGIEYFKLTAQWLAKMHKTKLKVTDIQDSIKREDKRFESYKKAFIDTGNPYRQKALDLIELVKEGENKLFTTKKEIFVQNHGDFHPKNIIIGYDNILDPASLFISVIDFNNSILMPCEFDVGYFLAQFKAQFTGHPAILNDYNEEIFLDAYKKEAGSSVKNDFFAKVKLFKQLANLSIASFYIKVGKGESEELASLFLNN